MKIIDNYLIEMVPVWKLFSENIKLRKYLGTSQN